jgi:hypothetical protein
MKKVGKNVIKLDEDTCNRFWWEYDMYSGYSVSGKGRMELALEYLKLILLLKKNKT